MKRALLIIAVCVSLHAQQQTIKIQTKYTKGEKFTVSAVLETKGEQFLTTNLFEGIGVTKISAKIQHEVCEFRDNCLYVKSKILELDAAGTAKRKGAVYSYSFKFKEGAFTESTVAGTDRNGKPIETKELVEQMKNAVSREWNVRQKKLNGDAEEARNEFGLLGPAFPPLFALPGTLPFADREVKTGDKFEDNGMNFTVESISSFKIISIKGIREPKRDANYYPEVSIDFNTDGYIASLKIRIVDKSTKETLLDYSSTATKEK